MNPPSSVKPKYPVSLADQIQEERRNVEYWTALSWSREKVIREWKEDLRHAEKNLKVAQERLAKLEAKAGAKA